MTEGSRELLVEAAEALVRHAGYFYSEVIELDGKISVEKDPRRIEELKSACGQTLATTGLAYACAYRLLRVVAEFDPTRVQSLEAAKERGIECIGARRFNKSAEFSCTLADEDLRHKLYKAWDRKVPKGRM